MVAPNIVSHLRIFEPLYVYLRATLDNTGLYWIILDYTGLDWIRLDYTGLDWIRLD
jgi:hypothetical protein